MPCGISHLLSPNPLATGLPMCPEAFPSMSSTLSCSVCPQSSVLWSTTIRQTPCGRRLVGLPPSLPTTPAAESSSATVSLVPLPVGATPVHYLVISFLSPSPPSPACVHQARMRASTAFARHPGLLKHWAPYLSPKCISPHSIGGRTKP
jgi:hypothetical protein